MEETGQQDNPSPTQLEPTTVETTLTQTTSDVVAKAEPDVPTEVNNEEEV